MKTDATSSTYRSPAFADALPGLAAPGATPERLAHLQEHGFVIINDFVDNPWIPVLREAGRRVTEACAPGNGYGRIDCSRGYVHRTGKDEPWAIRGLVHPAFNEPCFAEFHGSPDFLDFVRSWCKWSRPRGFHVWRAAVVVQSARVGTFPQLAPGRDVVGDRKTLFRAARDPRARGPEAYTEEIERERWAEIRANNARSITERNGVSMFPCAGRRRMPRTHTPAATIDWRTPFEHDVLLPKVMKEKGVPHTPSWNGVDPLPGQVAIRLKAGEALIRIGSNIHTGHTVPDREKEHAVHRMVEVVRAVRG